nr:hypothetical protein [Escherichia coli]
MTGAGTSAFIGDIIAPWLASHTGITNASNSRRSNCINRPRW